MRVSISYPFLLQMFELIEAKAKELKEENERLKEERNRARLDAEMRFRKILENRD